MLGAVLLANPADLGISPVASRWLGIIAVGLGILQGFLPRMQGPTTDPEALANRIDGMMPADRNALRAILELRHGSPPVDPLPPIPRYPAPPAEKG
jgi:hypothetical protein